MYRVTQTGWISSSHQVAAPGGANESIHGHNWRIDAALEAVQLDERGLVMDLQALKEALHAVLDSLDHTHLNDHPAFARPDGSPASVSAEQLARHVFDQLAAGIDDGRCRVAEVCVWMTAERAASYRR